MCLVYSEPSTSVFTLRTLPFDNAMQKTVWLKENIIPSAAAWHSRDSFGNRLVCGFTSRNSVRFQYDLQGTMETGREISLPLEDPPAARKYLYPTALTQPGNALKSFLTDLKDRLQGTDYDKALAIMHALHAVMKYQKHTTDIDTGAEAAFARRIGVCQDYAQIMTALCRLVHIPSRYVTGYLYGEGESHAWVEILSNGWWYGMDPTNDLLVDDAYIKTAQGRDSRDCQMNRGIVYSSADQTMTVSVNVCDTDRRQRKEMERI
jgi:transglutaminase-like putative cysteine protease